MCFGDESQYRRFRSVSTIAAILLGIGLVAVDAVRAEPDPKSYWNVNDVHAGMKGEGWTVLVGTKPEKFTAEVLGVLKDVNPGRDMVLCRLKGCDLEHAGIVQGMSGSPIYIDGKLLGAVAYAWEFAKDPIAGVTPFCQMVQFVRSSDKRIAAEAGGKDGAKGVDGTRSASLGRFEKDLLVVDSDGPRPDASSVGGIAVGGGGMAGMRAIGTPLSARGFSPRAMAFLADRLGPLGMAPGPGGGATDQIIKEEGDKPFVPGAPLTIAMVTGDFDISGIGTVTHVEGNRVYGFGHPMLGLGTCDLPLMTGYIHTVYPRASVSMKMGSPLKIVGVLDTDVSTCVAGRIGPKPDLLPMSALVKVGRYSEPKTFRVQIVREPNLLPTFVMSVLANAIDTEGNLPEEFTANLKATIKLKDQRAIEIEDRLSGSRFSGPMGAPSLFGTIAATVNLLSRNDMAPVRIESIDCAIDIERGRTDATIESFQVESDRLEPGQTLKGTVVLKPFKADRVTVPVELALPADLAEGKYEATVCDVVNAIRRTLHDEPRLMSPTSLEGVLEIIRLQTEVKHTALSLRLALRDQGIAIEGKPLPNLPASVRAVFLNTKQSSETPVHSELVVSKGTPYVIEGTRSLRIEIVKNRAVTANN